MVHNVSDGWIMQTLSTVKRHSVIRNIQISNFKSIASQSIPLGRFTVLIGENGAGKSNILEALVMASAATDAGFGDLKREVLVGRGMRMTSPTLMRSAFEASEYMENIDISIRYDVDEHEKKEINFYLFHDGDVYKDWGVIFNGLHGHNLKEYHPFVNAMRFFIYSPEYITLRKFDSEGQTTPLGVQGQGLAELLIVMIQNQPDRINEINEGLAFLGFCEEVHFGLLSNKKIYVKDRYIQRDGILIDQLSLNEGFLFCLFYLTLFTSSYTPKFFAIENIENGLNPKLVEALVKKLKELGVKYGKQAIISTHSPAILDALNLDDEENDVLLAVSRNLDGHTRVNRVKKPRNSTGKNTRLSELFLRGLLGGVPKNFV
jgi:predicted ATPase